MKSLENKEKNKETTVPPAEDGTNATEPVADTSSTTVDTTLPDDTGNKDDST